MEVYLVPIGRGRFELYCEPGEESHGPHAGSGASGLWHRLLHRFAAVVAAVEREHGEHAHPPHPDPHQHASLWHRIRGRFMRWLAERIAEQRLLWRLGTQRKVTVYFPASLLAEQVHETIRGMLGADRRRHLGWLAIDSIGGLLSLALVPLPGPNLPGYYFSFRIVGHLLSIRGAYHGLRAVRWDTAASRELEELLEAADGPEETREAVVEAVAQRLGLPRLVPFYRRTAADGA